MGRGLRPARPPPHQDLCRRHNADAFHSKVAVDVSAGIHTLDRESITVAAAGELWMRDRGSAGLERTTLINCRVYLDRHITPTIGTARLLQLTVPAARAFEDRLRARIHRPGMRISARSEPSSVTRKSAASWRRTSCVPALPKVEAQPGSTHRETPQGS